jgi:hypothetical protein
MANAPTGTKQKTYYVKEDVARIVGMIAERDDRRVSDVVSEALELYIKQKLSLEELRVFGYKTEEKHVRSKQRGDFTNGEMGGPPGKKK